ncbi:Cof-type HAD-IIB family hydrolase [Paenibacillus doosanensis]|uniref:Phosphatase YwpJ n=1 Tax=Paenibacillus konkukensis TaxID=2020716 RepID=A0ABY4RN86_9BACL|nr:MULTISPECIES: Cof-type HAD-IIB family hydrolase [Paenibacillus]MCS7460121.1 Cof-type HAD-IIB family hydrolase [Paenibacillus doosanensis]UQZ82777.1 Putative phosphatase YwpJ [Paenibacillus konkukensis]
MNYSLIALDIDGTLLNDDHEISGPTCSALQKVQAEGTRIVLCTGRGPGSAIPVLERLGMSGVLITHNGAATVRAPGREVLHEEGFSIAEITELVRYCRDSGVHFDVNTALDMYVEKLGAEAQEMYEQFLVRPHVIEDVLSLEDRVVKFTVFGSSEAMDRMEAELPGGFVPAGLRYIRSGAYFIDFMSGKASKGKALRKLAEDWDIPRERIMAMGNYFNDIEMLEFAGLGIAMENSPEAVKQAADAMTASNNEDGVYQALLTYGAVRQ